MLLWSKFLLNTCFTNVRVMNKVCQKLCILIFQFVKLVMFYLEIKIISFSNKCLPGIGTSFLTQFAMRRSGNISSIYGITVRDINTKRNEPKVGLTHGLTRHPSHYLLKPILLQLKNLLFFRTQYFICIMVYVRK